MTFYPRLVTDIDLLIKDLKEKAADLAHGNLMEREAATYIMCAVNALLVKQLLDDKRGTL